MCQQLVCVHVEVKQAFLQCTFCFKSRKLVSRVFCDLMPRALRGPSKYVFWAFNIIQFSVYFVILG